MKTLFSLSMHYAGVSVMVPARIQILMFCHIIFVAVVIAALIKVHTEDLYCPLG